MIRVNCGVGVICIFFATLKLIECAQNSSLCLPESYTKVEPMTKPVRYFLLSPNGTSFERQVNETVNVTKFYNSKIPGTCTPKCVPRCINAKCVLNDDNSGTHCDCLKGYKLSSSLRTCLPSCDRNKCKMHEKCVQPEVCACIKNYQNNFGICQPYCKGGCGPSEFCYIEEDEHSPKCASSVNLGTIFISSISFLAILCTVIFIAFVFSRQYKKPSHTPHTKTDVKLFTIDLGQINTGANIDEINNTIT